MTAILGILVVLGAVIGGFLAEGGHLVILYQPVEMLIIFGAALGSFLIASPLSVVKDVFKHLPGIFTAKEPGKRDYLDILAVLYTLFTEARRGGAVAMDKHVSKPDQSNIFAKHPSVLKRKAVCAFICDNLKIVVSGNVEHHYLESLMDFDIASRTHHALIPSQGVAKVADSLPGLGIVAAVLGVVMTMGKLNEPPEVLGHSIGAALLGTFLGVLMCYGFVGPMGANLEHAARTKQGQLKVAKAAISAYLIGLAPILAVEAGRRAIPEHVQPSFEELEQVMKNG
ncbi:MAG: flagellar motor stator protein MotA [Thermodesulfobacteriota bacterium]